MYCYKDDAYDALEKLGSVRPKKFLQLKLQRNIAKSRILSLVKMKF